MLEWAYMKRLCCLVCALCLAVAHVVAAPTPILALTAGTPDLPAQLQNEGIWFIPGGAKCDDAAISTATGGTGNWDGTSTAGLTAEQAAFVDKYHDIAQKLSIQYGIPWETVMAQGILESGAGTSEFARERNNFFGIGAFDSNPNNAFSYATPEEGWEGYYKNIVKTSVYRENGVFQEPTVTDPYAYLRAIKQAGYATDPAYVDKVSKFIKAIEARSKEKGWKSSAELAKENADMVANAGKNAGSGAAPVSAATGSTGADCDANKSAAPTGSIAKAAEELGKKGVDSNGCYTMGGGHGKDTAWLQAAIDNGFTGQYAVDCSSFVRATIYKATGKDPGQFSTSTMCTDSSKFEHVPRDQAQAGDFAIDCANHVEVITDVNGGNFKTVGAHSEGCGAGKGPSPDSYQGTESFVLRYKG